MLNRCMMALGIALLAVPAAAGVETSVAPGIDFSAFKTYEWVDGAPAQIPEIRAHMVRRIDEQLAAAGFRKVATNGDLEIVVHVVLESTYQVVSSYINSVKYDIALIRTDVTGYTDTALIVDLVDAGANRAVWQGRASDKIFDYRYEKMRNKVDRIVKKMFREFPPKAGADAP